MNENRLLIYMLVAPILLNSNFGIESVTSTHADTVVLASLTVDRNQ